MKAREKLLIAISVIACGISIAVFALVSLGHFIYTPGRTVVPVVGKMYETTVQQVALLEPVAVPPAPPSTSNDSKPPVDPPASSEKTSITDKQAADKKQPPKNRKNHKNVNEREMSYDDLQKMLASLFNQLLRED